MSEVALLNSKGQALPRGSVADGGHGDDGVGGAAAVGVVGVPQQAGVVAGGESGHPALPKLGLELVFGPSAYLVHLVHEQHAETSQPIWTETPRIWIPHKGIGPLVEESGPGEHPCSGRLVEFFEPGQGHVALVGVKRLESSDTIAVDDDEHDKRNLDREAIGRRAPQDHVADNAYRRVRENLREFDPIVGY